MNLNIPVKGPERIYLMLNLFSTFKPYSLLDNREKQVLSELFYMDSELGQLDESRRSRVIFDYDTRREIGSKYSISANSVYNIFSSLKKKGFIDGKKLLHKIGYTDKIIIHFTEDAH